VVRGLRRVDERDEEERWDRAISIVDLDPTPFGLEERIVVGGFGEGDGERYVKYSE